MKMPRSQCEAENIQFVQELAEIDGPFESPININFRDLTKLELPALVWNRGETCPHKMKITNTGHTVIVSGKWKCERPYLTGGPLSGKYVFSQIHFHWGQDDCKGSEHLVSGDGFPLEMHVAHFKTEYLTQECALREKDGMVVVVYLFKLQDKPNQSLKKIISLLPCVKQASTSHAVDPRPILTFCNPFTDDYFMYWGSVVTSTCAHILLWLICREPFGISKDQVNEFRKIMDSAQQPVSRNARDIQPLHRRNVFHVNASKYLDTPMLPIKNLLGCYCEENLKKITPEEPSSQDCKCEASLQEEVEGSIIEYSCGNHCLYTEGVKATHMKSGLPSGCYGNQTFVVQRATVQSVSLMVKRFGSEPVRNNRPPENSKQLKPIEKDQSKFFSKSCCFYPLNACINIKPDKRKARGKRPFNSIKAFSQIMHSLEVLKNHTFKKLREIESINQEIKGMKYFCQDHEDRKWLRRLERMLKRQKRFTIKSSQGCLSELRKLAKDCNFDKVFDCTTLSADESNGKILWLYNDKQNLTINMKPQEIPEKENLSSKHINVGRAIKFSAKAQKLIQSFFEDIQESDDLHETMKKDLNLKKIKSFCSKQAGDSNSVPSVIKGYITQNMFVMGNLGDRFFTEVTAEDFENDENQWKDTKRAEKLMVPKNIIQAEDITSRYKDEKTEETKYLNFQSHPEVNSKPKNKELIPLHRANVGIAHEKTSAEPQKPTQSLGYEGFSDDEDEKASSDLEILSDTESTSRDKKRQKSHSKKKTDKLFSKFVCKKRDSYDSIGDKLIRKAKGERVSVCRSSSNMSTETTETQRMIIAKFRRRRSRKKSWERNSSEQCSKSYTSLQEKTSCKEFKGYYIHKKNSKTKKTKKQKGEKFKAKSSSSKEDSKVAINKSKWTNLRKARFKIEIEKNDSLVDLSIENSIISPKRKKLKLEIQKGSSCTSRENYRISSIDAETQGADTDNDLDAAIKHDLEESWYSKLLEDSLSEKQQRMIFNTVSKTLGASSIDSRETRGTNDLDESCLRFQKGNKTLKTEILKHIETKPVLKSKSMMNIIPTTRISTEITQRLCLESLDERRKNNKEIFELNAIRKFERSSQIKKDWSYETLVETCESDEEQNLGSAKRKYKNESQTQTKSEYNAAFFTTTSQVDEELMPKSIAPEVKVKQTVLKRCDAGKYQFLEKDSHESLEPNDEYHLASEISQQTDSNNSFTKDSSKGDANPGNILNKDLQTSVSYLKVKKNSQSRPHSAETLNSITKIFKKKSKKRPHCCRRISRHFIRKNSSVIKKPNKAENKLLNFLSLTDQEQLKIISVNVANYLKQKLVEQDDELTLERTCCIKNVEQALFTKLKATQEKKDETPQKEVNSTKEEKLKQNKIPALNGKEKREEKLVDSEGKIKAQVINTSTEPKNEKPVCALPKPVNNFIKLNKLMAGKYKKKPVPMPEKKVQQKEKQKPPETPAKIENSKFKTRIPKKRVEKIPVQKGPEQSKTRSKTPSSPKSSKLSPKRNINSESRIKNSLVPKKKDSKNKELPRDVSVNNNNGEKAQELIMCDQNPKESLLTLQKTPMEKPLVPSYNLTSILPTPIEIVENQKRKLNRYLLGVDNCLPEVLFDNKGKDGNEALFRKELEYFIKLEMHLNKEISTNLENSMSMNYAKSTQGQDSYGSNFIGKTSTNDPLQFDSFNKEIVLLKMKDVECSSSGSDFVDDNFPLTRDTNYNKKNEDFEKSKEIAIRKIPKESGDPGTISPIIVCERQEETNSDSSYDCKISITLNTNFNVESENEQNVTEEKPQKSQEGDNKMPAYDQHSSQAESFTRQAKNSLGESHSQLFFMKQHRRKRKDNEISLEMKNKLLEILEGEIRREVGIKCDSSPENSSEGLTFKWDDSDGNNRSQSTGSSCDNIEVLTQISDTMRQYLKDLKEKGHLVEIINESSDKES